ncbi:MAG: MltA domain-containing protein [Bacteriovorax sp.]|nr:MltA domain-containing protein [Bacteriovorax sp.]
MRYLLCLFLFLTGCARAPLKRVEDAMRPVKSAPKFSDSLSRESFFIALKKHINVMKMSKQVADPMVFGDRKIEKIKYISALLKILEHESDWTDWIGQNFDFYEVYGRSTWGEVMSTGYYEPQVHGSHQKSLEFSRALYATPNDLVTINLKYFANKIPKGEVPGTLQGRIENKTIVPYFTRKEIDTDAKLKDQNLELAWLDPIDAFFIQIQGSGVVEFENGEKIRLGYDNQNGHAYAALGKSLKNIIPPEKMSMQKIKAYLKTLPADELQKILNINPSYVFFKKIESDALTYAGMEVSEGRTIATDLNFFPKGALAFLDIEEPQFATLSDIEPTTWLKLPRFVLDEDIGGAIRGGGRVDLYFGKGDTAAQKAGVMKQKGRLYYLVPRN